MYSERVPLPSTEIVHWASVLRERGLVNLAIPLLDVLQVWGFVGSHLLWMLIPFVGGQVTQFAEALEHPETLQKLQQILIEGEI